MNWNNRNHVWHTSLTLTWLSIQFLWISTIIEPIVQLSKIKLASQIPLIFLWYFLDLNVIITLRILVHRSDSFILLFLNASKKTTFKDPRQTKFEQNSKQRETCNKKELKERSQKKDIQINIKIKKKKSL